VLIPAKGTPLREIAQQRIATQDIIYLSKKIGI